MELFETLKRSGAKMISSHLTAMGGNPNVLRFPYQRNAADALVRRRQ